LIGRFIFRGVAIEMLFDIDQISKKECFEKNKMKIIGKSTV